MKTLLFVLIVSSLAFAGCKKKGCMDAAANNYYSEANKDDGSCNYEPIIGYTFQGGIVFYLDGNGGGLIAAPTDQALYTEWGCEGTEITGADGTGVGTGYQNTIDIEAGCTTGGTAADICANLTLGGYSDWFLPSHVELDLMRQNLHLEGLGGFVNNGYWSSTEDDYFFAYRIMFGTGGQAESGKGTNLYVRAIRAF